MKENHRVATIFASVFTLIQSVLWCLIAIYSVAVYACQADFPFPLDQKKVNIPDLLFLSYYYGECRAPPGEPMIEAPSAARTYYWMLVYGIISAIWIPTSVLLLVAAANRIDGKYGACLFLPWIINTVIILIADVCATVIYALDISHTLTVKDYGHFIQPLEPRLRGADGITVVPAVELTVYFSRAIVFWLLNFILLGVVIQGSRTLRRRTPVSAFVENDDRMKGRNEGTTSHWVNMAKDDLSMKRLPRLQLEDSSPSRSRSPLAPISPQSPISETPTPFPQRVAPVPPSPLIIPNPVALPRDRSHTTGDTSPVYDVYGKHLGNSVPEEIHKHIPTNDAAQKSGLSNQVPWTYAQPVELNLRIKQAALQHKNHPVKPSIPDPDYTVRFRQERRPDLSDLSRSNSEASSYPDQSLNRRRFID